MTLKDYMDSLPDVKQQTINRIAKETVSHKVTVYRWINGETTPPKNKREIISRIVGCKEEELFPEEKNQ